MKKFKEFIIEVTRFLIPWTWAIMLVVLTNEAGFKHAWLWLIFPIITSCLFIYLWYDELKNPDGVV